MNQINCAGILSKSFSTNKAWCHVPSATSTIARPFPCEMTLTNPLQKYNVPIVATIYGIPILVTRSPLTSPANIPKIEAKAKAIKKLPSVAVNIKPKVSEVIPTIEGNDKSISPSVITKVTEIAIIPKNGIDCIKAL